MDPMADAIVFAARSGRSGELESVFDIIEMNLSQTPRTWGDPQRTYTGMNATLYVRHMVPNGIRVKYLVHNIEPVVVVRSISPIDGGPFDPNALPA
jgi:hypothetical protein